ncbi:ABC transporter A family member 2-like isoform X1 [Lycium ferocissimum]|uniref:ABC transporter A family member 2-like isoform X1 n=1 Tax=Lycium ferocissimum TaxID=112874 RepID=UPI0028152B34|nr:ABC transporter A family member 2-like isoform X1 [Lycium ferocissimum]
MAMELQSGFSLFWQQTIALLKKNFLLSMRSKRATFLQLFSSLFFLGLLLGIQKAMDFRSKHPSAIGAVNDPQPLTNPAIPPCEHKFFIKRPCYDFVWSGSGNKRIESIVSGILVNNPGRPIPSTKVKSFGTKDDLNNWLLSDPMRTPGALHFVERNATVVSYGVVTNTSTYIQVPRIPEDPTFKFQLPLQLAASREIARSLLGDSKFRWNVGLKEFAHPVIEDPEAGDSFQKFAFVAIFSPIFFYAISIFGFVFQISSMVLEKELKLRQAMTVMGLFDSAYWCSWLIWEGIMTFLSSLLIVLFGMMFQLHLFLKNSFLIVLLLFFLFQLNMVGFAFLISNFIRKSASTTTASFAIFVIGCVTQTFSAALYSDTNHKTSYRRTIWSLFPPNPFSGGLNLLLFAADHDGISWSRLSQCDIDDEAYCYSILHYYRWLVATFFLWLVLAIYLDNIIPNSAGVRKPFYYFLKPGYWTGRGEEKFKENAPCCGSGSAPPNDNFTQDDEDVLDEENRVKQAAKEGNVDPNVAVQLQDLYKMYSRTINFSCHSCCLLCCYCRCKIKKPYKAVQGLWLNLEKDQLFCLLGPNGAGKTTVISCLTGITPVTRGNALIYGNSVRSSVGISNIRKLIGVCSQFDTLWDALSGQEHLELFATIKGLSPTSKRSEAKKLLADVKLDDVAKVRAGSYSGGMKRRLSLGIALIGDPKLLFLDEPTTGMDPVTRRHIWSVIEAAKQGRSIVLTTHSMEEADILSDRIGIMAKGRLRCVGTSTLLKSRFGAGFIAKISFSKVAIDINAMANTIGIKHHEAVKKFFSQHIDVAPKDEDKSFLTFIIPHEKEKLLENFFAELDNRKTEFGILSIQIGLTTLEEVFLNIAKKAELEVAASEETIKTLILPSGTTLQVPLGSKYVEIPGTISTENPRGLMVEVYWEQDDHGNLCISGHSDETTVPPNLQISTSSLVIAKSRA